MVEAALHPLAGNNDAPHLLVADGCLIARRAGKPDVVLPIAGGGAAVLGYYDSAVNIPANSRGGSGTTSRSGWRVLDAQGRCLWWLIQDTWPAYDLDEASAFAHGAGLELRHLGDLTLKQLLGDRGRSLGPGTSLLGGLIAPRRSWVLSLLLVGGLAIGFAPLVGPTSWPVGLGVSWVLLWLLGGIIVGQTFGVWWYAWRSERFLGRAECPLLRPRRRPPAAVIAVVDGDLVAYDYVRHFRGGGPAHLELFTGGRRGLAVRWAGTGDYVLFDTHFDEPPVRQWAEAFDVEVRQVAADSLATKPAADSRARLRFVTLLRPVLFLAPVLALAAGMGALVGAAGLVHLLDVSVPWAVALLGIGVMFLGGVGLVGSQFSDALVRPRRLVPRPPLGSV